MWEDYWSHRFADDPKLAEESRDDGFDLEEEVRRMDNEEWEPEEVTRYGH